MTPAARPFIYIASLRRTGSTLVSEMLTSPDDGFIFREPRLGHGLFRTKPDDVTFWQERGVDLHDAEALIRKAGPGDAPRAFRDTIYPRFAGHVHQLGIKEISHGHPESFEGVFPDLRVIATARDPRDIYLSLYHRQKVSPKVVRFGEPEVLVADLMEAFEGQRVLMKQFSHLRVRYEDLCREPEMIERIRSFAGSEIRGRGSIGEFKEENRAKHGHTIGTSMVARYKTETDVAARAGAERVRRLMLDYCRYWGYD